MKWTNKGHQFDTLKFLFQKRNSILIYGAGVYGAQVFDALRLPFVRDAVVGFVDRDKEKQRIGYLGKPVYDPSILFDRHDEDHLIVVAMIDEKATKLMLRLERAGYVKNWDFFYYDRFLRVMGKLNSPFLYSFALYARGITYISSLCMIPGTQCNLNCRECLNFTPYLPRFTVRPIEEVIKDVDLFFQWVDYTPRFQISGGEPLLYPDLARAMDYIGENYRSKIDSFEVVTNGTLLPSTEILASIQKNCMTVYLDNYTSALPKGLDKRKEIIERLETYQINWVDNTVEEWFTLDIENTDNSCMPEDELAEYYDTCAVPWHCFENGKFYSCNFARFAMKAGLNTEDKNDCFDLSTMTEEDRPELMEFLLGYTEKGYVNFCKRCAGWGPNNLRAPIPVAEQAKGRIATSDDRQRRR